MKNPMVANAESSYLVSMYWKQVPADAGTRLGEIAELLRDCRSTFHAVTGASRWRPGVGSTAAADLQNLPCPDPRVPAAGRSSGFGLVSEVLSSYAITAAGLLGEVAAAFDHSEVFYLPPIGFRGVLENCARTTWVIGNDPAEPSDARLARAYHEALVSAEQANMQAKRLGGGTEVQQRKATELQQLRQQIITVFPQTTLADLTSGPRTRQIGGHGLLGPESCVEWMFDLLARGAGSNITTRESLGIYGLLSNFTHPTLHVTREMQEFVRDGSDVVSVHELDMQFVEKQARLAVSVFYNVMAYLTSYFGWPRAPHDELTTRIDVVMPRMFRT